MLPVSNRAEHLATLVDIAVGWLLQRRRGCVVVTPGRSAEQWDAKGA
jgi:hypothetical protein